MDELLEQFLIEAPELVQQASDDLLALEDDPANSSRVDSAFRAVHTLKGSVALFDFAPMAQALHAAEGLLDDVRAARLADNRPVMGALLECIGACDRWVKSIAAIGSLPIDAEAEARRLTNTLTSLSRSGATADVPSIDKNWVSSMFACDAQVMRAIQGGRAITSIRYAPNTDCFFHGDDPLARVRCIPELIGLRIEGSRPWATESFDPYSCNLLIYALSTAPVRDIREIFGMVGDQAVIVDATSSEETRPAAIDAGDAAASRTLRVNSGQIDALVDLVGEMIVAKNGIAHLATQMGAVAPQLARQLATRQAEMDRLVGDMHRALMNVRMVPLARTFRRFPRLIRDLALKLGKNVILEMKGEDVEADKAIVDGVFDPLLHVLRNAVDHGIEMPETRRRSGKPPNGRVLLEAERRRDQILISVVDDGGGIDVARIRQAAKAAGVVSSETIDALDDVAAIDLIFSPGLSTASAVTEISGRGVGMDVARTAIEALGGRITINNAAEGGAVARIALPQAVVMTTVMTVAVGEEHFGVPMDAVQETVRVPTGRITAIRSGSAFVLRDRTIPFVRLCDLLKLPNTAPQGNDAKVLVTSVGGQSVGVAVSGFAERIDVLLRPMSGLLAGMPGMLGTALLGDGRVLVVLDLPELLA